MSAWPTVDFCQTNPTCLWVWLCIYVRFHSISETFAALVCQLGWDLSSISMGYRRHQVRGTSVYDMCGVYARFVSGSCHFYGALFHWCRTCMWDVYASIASMCFIFCLALLDTNPLEEEALVEQECLRTPLWHWSSITCGTWSAASSCFFCSCFLSLPGVPSFMTCPFMSYTILDCVHTILAAKGQDRLLHQPRRRQAHLHADKTYQAATTEKLGMNRLSSCVFCIFWTQFVQVSKDIDLLQIPAFPHTTCAAWQIQAVKAKWRIQLKPEDNQ